MKSHRDQTRRVDRAFNSIDSETGYAVRFEKNRQGWWYFKPNAFVALSLARRLRAVRRHTHEVIHYCFETAAEHGWPVPKPERKETSQL